MAIEYEIKVLNIEIDLLKERLMHIGAKQKGIKHFRRYVYDINPPVEEKWIRLRTDGQKHTLTVKQIIDPSSIDGVREWEIEVGDFEETNALLEQLGYKAKGYQENIRESRILDDCCLDIDTRPLIPSYMEIEGNNEESVMNIIKKLNLEKCSLTSENTTNVYKRYGFDIENFPILKFE